MEPYLAESTSIPWTPFWKRLNDTGRRKLKRNFPISNFLSSTDLVNTVTAADREILRVTR